MRREVAETAQPRKTKIVCTIGPTSCSREDLFRLADSVLLLLPCPCRIAVLDMRAMQEGSMARMSLLADCTVRPGYLTEEMDLEGLKLVASTACAQQEQQQG